MGQVESAPQQPYQPDFLTSHVKAVSKQLAPRSAPMQAAGAANAVGSDSLVIVQARKAQESISGGSAAAGFAYGRPGTPPPGASSYGADTFMHNFLQQQNTIAHTPQQHTVDRPRVGSDAWLLQKQAKMEKPDPHPRNRFGLLPEKGTPEKIHQTIDGYETAFCLEAKAGVTPKPVQSNGRTFGPEQGQTVGIKKDSYSVQFGKDTKLLTIPKQAPQSLAEWQGIRPKIPVDHYAASEYKEKLDAIREANAQTPLPAPQLPIDTFMVAFTKDTAEADNHNRPGSPPPPRGAVSGAAAVTPNGGSVSVNVQKAAAAAAPEEDVGSAPPEAAAADSFILSFAKSVSSFTPSKRSGKSPPSSKRGKTPKEIAL